MTLDTAAIDWLTGQVLEALERDGGLDPLALTFLMRRYCAGADVADALGTALAHALEAEGSADALSRQAEWLAVFAEAATVSDDPRLDRAAADRLASVRQQLSRERQVEPLTLAIGACLTASGVLDAGELLPFAIDELERVIGAAYRPGDGLAQPLGEPDGVPRPARRSRAVRIGAADGVPAHGPASVRDARRRIDAVRAAHALGRSRGRLFRGTLEASQVRRDAKPFALNCEAARALCRLAALHETEEYRRAAVLTPGADYGRDAARTLESLAPFYRERGADAAIYGLALGEWLGLR